MNKQMQKMKKMRRTLAEATELSQGLVKSEIFSKLRYEASLTANSSGAQQTHDNSDDMVIAMQANDFI